MLWTQRCNQMGESFWVHHLPTQLAFKVLSGAGSYKTSNMCRAYTEWIPVSQYDSNVGSRHVLTVAHYRLVRLLSIPYRVRTTDDEISGSAISCLPYVGELGYTHLFQALPGSFVGHNRAQIDLRPTKQSSSSRMWTRFSESSYCRILTIQL